MRRYRILAIATALLLTGCTGAPKSGAPTTTGPAGYEQVTLKNCDFDITISAPPKAAVTLNQGATEVMLALGLEGQMAGTAYLDDQVPQRWRDAYAKVSVLAPKYPSKETFLAAKPDFAYASYASAFTDKAVGSRDELGQENISSYLSPMGCPKGVTKAPASMDSAWAEITDVARIFGVKDRADALVASQKDAMTRLQKQAAGKGKSVLWYDSGDKELFAGVGNGGPQVILDTVGAENIFADIGGGWQTVSWEKVVSADPDVIVLADADWSRAKDKIAHLEADPVLSKLKAVRAKAYITVPFSETTPGVRLVDGATAVAEQIAKL